MTADELKSMPKGHFIFTKTGVKPMKTILRLFTLWKIKLDKKYEAEMRHQRTVEYADINKIESILKQQFHHVDLPETRIDINKSIRKAGIKIE